MISTNTDRSCRVIVIFDPFENYTLFSSKHMKYNKINKKKYFYNLIFQYYFAY